MNNSFQVKFDFMEKWGRFAKGDYLQIYLYILYILEKDKKVPTVSELAKKLDKDNDAVETAIDFWITAGVLAKCGRGYSISTEEKETSVSNKKDKGTSKSGLRERPSYTSAEIDAVAAQNKGIDTLFKQAEEILGRILSPSDFELIYSFVDWLGLPVEVVIMLLQYAASRGKTAKRYLETVAIDWADKGIDNYESAEEYIREIELKLSNEGKIRGILGIYDRALTQTEKKYIKAWTFEKYIPSELVAEAYDRTVAATGKLSWQYMNKILISWNEEGLKTVDEVREKEALFKLKSAPTKVKTNGKKSKFNNYEDTNKPDYSNFAEQILKDMLGE